MCETNMAPHLVLLSDVLLVVLLHLPELGFQTSELDLHFFHILEVPLSPLVQYLDGLGHVLDLETEMKKHERSACTHIILWISEWVGGLYYLVGSIYSTCL